MVGLFVILRSAEVRQPCPCTRSPSFLFYPLIMNTSLDFVLFSHSCRHSHAVFVSVLRK